ncbi:MAG: class I SAM-dependent methyltransferase [Planctomycetota bacterium]|nr:class I SAM-dependent methyltransferase [Planctomycetota bacterium]
MSDLHPSTARVRDIFDDWARRGRAEGMETGHGPSARAGIEHLDLGEGSHYLDIGCGNGYTLRWVSAGVGADGRAVGIDVAPAMVERARALSSAFENVEVLLTAFPAHPFEAGTFDGIFSMEVLYYLPDLPGALAEIRQLLKPGGRFACVVDYYAENPESHDWPEQLGCDMALLSEAEWGAAFEAAGLEVVAQERVRYPLAEGAEPGWKQTIGSLLTVGQRPS